MGEVEAVCDMCHKTLVCKDHLSPIKFDKNKLEKARKENFIHCELCFRVKEQLFKNMLWEVEAAQESLKNFPTKEIRGIPDLETLIHNAIEEVKQKYPDLREGECLNHQAKLMPKEKTRGN